VIAIGSSQTTKTNLIASLPSLHIPVRIKPLHNDLISVSRRR